MARLHHFIIFNHFNRPLFSLESNYRLVAHRSCHRSAKLPSSSHFRIPASSMDNHSIVAQKPKRSFKRASRASRSLITLSTACGRWQGQWSSEYLVSLRALQLADLADEGSEDAEVLVNLSIQKHTGFGFSVDGRIITSFKRKCSCCCLSYCKEIDTTFDVWVLPSSKDSEPQLPEIGGSDQVIYVKPGSEADLDSVVQDTIRLIASIKDTCSKTCEKSVITWQFTEPQRSYDQRWSQLLQLKNSM